MNQVTLSIAMSVYDGVNSVQLKRAVESILNQTYGNFEFIIYSDGVSKLDLLDYFEEISDERVRVVYSDINNGLAFGLNNIIKTFSGDIFVRMDADDISLPNRLQEIVNYSLANPKVDIFGSAMYQLDTGLGSLDACLSRCCDAEIIRYPTKHSDIKKMFLYRNSVSHPTVAIRRDVFNEGIYYPLFSLRNEDTLLWLSFFKRDRVFGNISKPLYVFDFSEDTSLRRTDVKKAYSDMLDRFRVIFDLGGGIRHCALAMLCFVVTITPFYNWVRNAVIK
ncbi:glycosyltransferase [Vibrio profundi]|uniref:glycosyltransferase n=1 Tax=Vibrio profundi TaxID=1774960 RepID=UPI003735A67B